MSEPPEYVHSLPAVLRDGVVRWWERASLRDPLPEIYEALPQTLKQEFVRVIAGSEFAASALIQDPQALGWLTHHAVSANEEYERRAAAAATTADAQRILREWRRREMLRIAWRDIAGHADVIRYLARAVEPRGWLHPCRSGGGAGAPSRPVRHAAGHGRLRGAADRARHGEAWRPRAEFFLRYRSRVLVRAGRGNRRRPRGRQ